MFVLTDYGRIVNLDVAHEISVCTLNDWYEIFAFMPNSEGLNDGILLARYPQKKMAHEKLNLLFNAIRKGEKGVIMDTLE